MQVCLNDFQPLQAPKTTAQVLTNCSHLSKTYNYLLLLKFFAVDTPTTTQKHQLPKVF